MLDYLYKYFYLMFKDQMEGMKGDTPQNYSVYMLSLGLIIWLCIISLAVDVILLINGHEPVIIEKWDKLYTAIIITALLITSVFYYFLYRKYVKSGYYLILYNKSLNENPKQILLGRFVTISYMFLPVLFIIILFLVRRKFGPAA